MRILHVHKYFHREDGASRYMVELMQLQEKAGHTVAPFAMHDPRNLPSAWERYFVSALETKKVAFGFGAPRQLERALWSREAKQKMTEVVEAFQPDIVHIHNIYNHLSPSILGVCRKRGIPMVMTVHDYALVSANYALWDGTQATSPHRRGILTTAATRFAKGSFVASFMLTLVQRAHRWLGVYRSIAKFMVFSEFVHEELRQARFPEQKIVEVFPFSAPLLVGDLPKPAAPRQGVLFAGRLEPYKGIALLLRAAEKLPEVDFYFAGKGSCDNWVSEAAAKHKNIHQLGFLQDHDLWTRMSAAQVVAVPSLWAEPFGLVALEALVIGTPILVSDRGALPELVRDNSFGRIFKADDEADFERQLQKFLKQDASLEKMGKKASEWARKMAAPDKHLGRVMEVYHQVMEDHR